MRTEIGVHPWAHMFMPYLNGQPLQDCRMADEELGCAEVYADVEVLPSGAQWRRSTETRMVFGDIEDRPLTDVACQIKANPEQAKAIWAEYQAEMRRKYGD